MRDWARQARWQYRLGGAAGGPAAGTSSLAPQVLADMEGQRRADRSDSRCCRHMVDAAHAHEHVRAVLGGGPSAV